MSLYSLCNNAFYLVIQLTVEMFHGVTFLAIKLEIDFNQ